MRITNVKKPRTGGGKLVYCGRACGAHKASPLGNPFVIGRDGTREEVIQKFRVWLWDHLNRRGDDPECRHADWDVCPVRAAISHLTADSTLACWCCESDAAETEDWRKCHTVVIAKAWAWLQTQA